VPAAQPAPPPPLPSPQASLSQLQALSPAAGANLLHELLGFLRKSLGQQAAVRAALYTGLGELLAADPSCCQVGPACCGPWCSLLGAVRQDATDAPSANPPEAPLPLSPACR
jgi:hypothetical protein